MKRLPSQLISTHGSNPSKRKKLSSSEMDINQFHFSEEIGRGGFGIVYRVQDQQNEQVRVIKMLKQPCNDDSEVTEARILLGLNHQNIIQCFGTVRGAENKIVGILFEYVDYTLKSVINALETNYVENHVKLIMRQLLAGVKFLHENRIVHRDLKASNVLIQNNGRLKIIDFGLSKVRPQSNGFPFHGRFGTLQYCAPEVLLGSPFYSYSVDVWAVGCIFASILLNDYLFYGEDGSEQLEDVFSILGTPTEETWPGVMNLPGMKQFKKIPQYSKSLLEQFDKYRVTKDSYLLLEKLLQLNPTSRISISDAYHDKYFDGFQKIFHHRRVFAEWLEQNLQNLPEKEHVS